MVAQTAKARPLQKQGAVLSLSHPVRSPDRDSGRSEGKEKYGTSGTVVSTTIMIMLTILSACNEYLLFDFSVAVHFLSWNVDHNHAKAKGCCWQSLLVVLPSSSLKIFTSSSCFSEAALVTG